ncbi:MAG: FHA domain-containing protein [Acidobacteriota bacterium]
MLELVLLDGTNRRFLLTEGSELTVGAAAQSSVRLAATDVSRQHSMVSCVRGRVVLLDLGSTNGTFVNGKRVKEAELKGGDTIRFSSVLAQVLPPSSPASGQLSHARQQGNAGTGQSHGPATTSDVAPIIRDDSLVWLLARWSSPENDAMGTLVEWLVAQRGLRAAAVLEVVAGEVGVLAAHGGLAGLLDDRRILESLGDGAIAGGSVETAQMEFGGQTAFTLRSGELPCLVIVPNAAMPDTGELELFIRLLAVAERLDRGASPSGA